MTGPELLQVVPPGQLQMHGPVAALSPALLAALAGLAAWISPGWRHGLAMFGCLAAWLLLALALLPGGAAAAYQQPMAQGWLAFGPFAVTSALITAVVVAFFARRLPPWWWAQMVALSLVIPLVVCARIPHA